MVWLSPALSICVGWSLNGTCPCPCWPVYSAWALTPCRTQGWCPEVIQPSWVWVGEVDEGRRPLGPGDGPQALHLLHGPISLSNSRLRSMGPCAWSCLGPQVQPDQPLGVGCCEPGSRLRQPHGQEAASATRPVQPLRTCVPSHAGSPSPGCLPQAALLASLLLMLRTSCPYGLP